jgi:preprotein translocase subunit SecA
MFLIKSICYYQKRVNTLYISHQIADLREIKDIYVYIWQAVNTMGTTEHTAHNIEQIQKYIEKLIAEKQIQYPSNLEGFVQRRLKSWINNAYIAKLQIEEGNQYSVLDSGKKAGQCVINDLQTGVEQMNTQWSEGLQQFIQLKHTNKLNEESLKAIFMSNYIFFMKYQGNIYGMTGTLGASLERELLNNAYGLDFFQLPRFKKELNVRMEPVLVATRAHWLARLKDEVNAILDANRIIDPKEVEKASGKKGEITEKLQETNGKIKELVDQIMDEEKKQKAAEASGASSKPEEKTSLKKELSKFSSQKEDLECKLEDISDITGIGLFFLEIYHKQRC